jgi:CheY-like chemotaxis protein
MALRKYSKEILRAENGKEAIELLKQNTDIDLIMMDIQLPIMDGYEATRLIRQFNKDVIIVAQTAFALSGEKEKAIEAGCTDYVSKPVSIATLKEMLNKYFEI